ncbi:hypothetical protein D6C81_03379, partial [Aureobasidium pullulans]
PKWRGWLYHKASLSAASYICSDSLLRKNEDYCPMQELFGHVMEGSIAQRETLNLLLGATWQIVSKSVCLRADRSLRRYATEPKFPFWRYEEKCGKLNTVVQRQHSQDPDLALQPPHRLINSPKGDRSIDQELFEIPQTLHTLYTGHRTAPVSYMYYSLLDTVYATKLILEQFSSVVNSFVAVSNWTELCDIAAVARQKEQRLAAIGNMRSLARFLRLAKAKAKIKARKPCIGVPCQTCQRKDLVCSHYDGPVLGAHQDWEDSGRQGPQPRFASVREPEEVIAEELEQLAITEEESIIMPDTAAEINEATAASVTRADMDMAVFCHKADEQKIVSGMWSEVHLLHRLRVIFEQEALPIDDLEELEMARRVRLVMADL